MQDSRLVASLGCIIAFVLMTASIAKAQAVPKMKMITDIPATKSPVGSCS